MPGYLGKWLLRAAVLALPVGTIVAFFLWSLDKVVSTFNAYQGFLFALPLAGIAIHFLYKAWGKSAEAGNNLIIDEIHQPGGGVPFRMAPLVLVTTLITHLFGGSAGREGTAVQIGGGLAGYLSKKLGLNHEDVKVFLMMGISAGFGAVFGTPIAGAIFAIEVLTIGRFKYQAIVPCILAAVFADRVCMFYPVHHTHYNIASGFLPTGMWGFTKFGLALLFSGVAFGLAARLFASLTHNIKDNGKKIFKKHLWLMPATGGVVIICLTFAVGNCDFNCLGVTGTNPDSCSIVNAFVPSGGNNWGWLLKLVFTAITIGSGFKGGEVTPLFFIGATLGKALALQFGLPVDLWAGLGFIAVFAGAANTPLACAVMGVELFGGTYFIYFLAACFIAFAVSGKKGIYSAQRVRRG